MAYDGTVKFDTKLDSSGLESGLKAVGAAITATLGAAAAAAIKVGSDFESAMSSVSAISQASAEDSEMMRNAALEAGEATQFSATQSANALEYLSLAGYSASESVEALPKVLNLAAAGGMDLAYASDLLTDSMAVLGLGIEDMDNFSDQLAMAASKSNTSVSQLGEAVLVAGGQAKLCGMSVEEMNTALGILADKGIKGSEGGTALRNVLKNLYTPTNDSAKAMNSLGVETADAEGNLRSVQDVLQDLNSALSELSEEDKTKAMADIFDTRSIAAATALLDDCGDRWNELEGYLKDCEGAAEQMADTMQDNLQGKLKLCASAAESVGIAVYDGIKEPLKEAADAGAQCLSKLATSLRSGELSQGLSKVGELLGKLATSVISLASSALPILINVLGTVASHINVIAPAVIAVVAAIKAYSAATTIAATVTKLLNATIALNPYALAAAGVAALAVAITALATAEKTETEAEKAARQEREAFIEESDELIQKTQELQNAHDSLTKSYQDSLDDAAASAAVAEDLKDRLAELISKEDKTLANKKEISTIVEDLNGLLPGLGLSYDEETDKLSALNGEMENTIELIDEYIEAKKKQAEADAALELYKEEYKEQIQYGQQKVSLEEKITEAKKEQAEAQKNLNKAEEEYKKAWGFGGGGLAGVDEARKNVKYYKEQYDEITAEVEELEGSYAELNGTIAESEKTQAAAWDSYIEATGGAAEATASSVENIKSAFESLGSAPNTLDGMKTALQELYDEMAQSGTYGEDLMTAFKTALETGDDEVFNSIESFIDYVGELMGEAAGDAAEAAGDAAGEAVEAVSTTVSAAMDGVETTIETSISGWDFTAVTDKTSELGLGLITKMAEGIASGAGTAESAVSEVVGAAEEAASDAGGGFEAVGSGIVQKVADGIASNSGTAEGAATGVVGAAEAAASAASGGFESIGANMAQGIADGINENAGAATSAMSALVNELITIAKDIPVIESPSHVMRDEVGAMLDKGIAVGIEKNTGAATNAMSNLMTDLITTAKDAAEIRSPSHMYRDQVGALIAEGVAIGIEENAKKATEAYKKLASQLKAQAEMDLMSWGEYYDEMQKARDMYLTTGTKEWLEATEDLYSGTKKLEEDATKALEKAIEDATKAEEDKQKEIEEAAKKELNTIDYYHEIGEMNDEEYYKNLEDIRDRYFEEDSDSWRDYTKKLIKYQQQKLETVKEQIQDAYSDAFEGVAEKRESMADKLKDAGVLYSSGTVEIAGEETGWAEFANLKSQIEYLENYRDLILRVKERLKGLDLPEDELNKFFNNLAEMDVEEGTVFANLLNNVTESEFAEYISDWVKKQQISEDIADAIYGEETQEAAAEFENELAAILENAGVEIPDTFFDIGKEAAKEFGKQFCDGISDVLSRAQSMITSFFAASGLSGLSGGEGESSYSSTYNFYGSGETVSEQLRSAQNAAAVERARYA